MAKARVTKTFVEALVESTANKARATYVGADVLVRNDLASARASSVLVEVLYQQKSYPFGLAAGKFRGAAHTPGGKKNAATTSLTIAKPATEQGDVLIASISDNAGAATTVTPPAGWTLVQARQTSGNALGQAVYIYPVGPNPPANFTWTLTGTVNSAGIIEAFRNVGAVGVVGTQTNAASTSIVAPSVISPSANAMLVFIGTTAANTTIAPPAGMAEDPIGEQATTGVTTEIAFSTPTPSGATGTRTAVAGASAQNIGTLLTLDMVNTEIDSFGLDAYVAPYFGLYAQIAAEPVDANFTGAIGSADSLPGHVMPGRIGIAEVEGSFGLDAVLLATGSATFSLDAVVRSVTEGSYGLSAVVAKTQTSDGSLDAILLASRTDGFSLEAYLLSVRTADFGADAIVLAPRQASAPLDAILLQTQLGSASLDAIKLATQSDTFSLEALLLKVVEADAALSAIILKTQLATFGASAWISDLHPAPAIDATWAYPATIAASTAAQAIASTASAVTWGSTLTTEPIAGMASADTWDAALILSHTDTFGLDAVIE